MPWQTTDSSNGLNGIQIESILDPEDMAKFSPSAASQKVLITYNTTSEPTNNM